MAASIPLLISYNSDRVHTYIHAYVGMQQPIRFQLCMYVIAGVDPDPFTQAAKTILSGLAINLTSLN